MVIKEKYFLRAVEQLKNHYSKMFRYSVIEKYDIQDEADIVLSIINLNKRHKPEKKFYILLHEIGHLLVSREPNFQTKFKFALYAKKTKSLSYYANVVEQEICAWSSGQEFGEWLNFKIDIEKFNALKNKYLCSYIYWAQWKKMAKKEPKKKAARKQ